jgi:predicted amidohydrolase
VNPNVAVAQMNCTLGNVKRNLKKINSLTYRAARHNADLVCFPELATTGYRLGRAWRKYAETIPGPTSEKLSGIAEEYGLHLICGVDELDAKSKRIRDSSILVDPNGDTVGVYRKVHLWAKEREYFTPGKTFPIFQTKFGKIGLGICYDLEFPEPARIMALQGAEIIVYSSAQMKPMQRMIDTYVCSRAGENTVFVCHSNRVGVEGDLVFFGHSQVIHPTCQPLAKMTETEGLALARLEMQDIKRLRKTKLPYLRQRIPKLYSVLGKPPKD